LDRAAQRPPQGTQHGHRLVLVHRHLRHRLPGVLPHRAGVAAAACRPPACHLADGGGRIAGSAAARRLLPALNPESAMSRFALLLLTFAAAAVQGAELKLSVEIPRLAVAEYHRLYVAAWIERGGRSVVAQLAMGYQQT